MGRGCRFVVAVLGCTIGSGLCAQGIREMRFRPGPGCDATSAISALAFQPKSDVLMTANRDHYDLQFCDAATGEEISAIGGTDGQRICMAFSPDGRLLATGDVQGRVVLLFAAAGSGELQKTGSCVYGVAFSPDGRWLAACFEDGTVKVWDTEDGHLCQTIVPGRAALYAVAFASDGATIATAGLDGVVCIHNLIDGQPLRVLTGHRDAVYSLSFSPDGRNLVTGSGDGTVRWWDPETGKQKRCLSGHREPIYTVGFDAAGQRLLSADTGGLVVLWDAETWTPLYSHRLPGKILCAALSPEGQRVAAGNACGKCYLIDLPQHLRDPLRE